MQILFLLFLIGTIYFGGKFLSLLRGLGRWNQTYQRLGQRYAGKSSKNSTGGVLYGYLLNNPGLLFDYGRTFVILKNRRSSRFPERRETQLGLNWPDKKLKLEISTRLYPGRGWSLSRLKPVELNNPLFLSHFSILSNQPNVTRTLLTDTVQWQLEQLRVHTGNAQLSVELHRGELLISKPGFIKDYQQLDDFVRFGLDLFDQMMLVKAEGIEFLHEHEASIVSEVKCPICSEQIEQEMVVCQRCKTPHCLDCWQYNGQCATFACRETRYLRVGGSNRRTTA